jgi:hypothetical protein
MDDQDLSYIQHKSSVSLEARLPLHYLGLEGPRPRKYTQSSSLLYLDQDLFHCNAFYAHNELFSSTGLSEVQFLNMMEAKTYERDRFLDH